MAFDSFGEFVHMGGYGLYVWSSFFLTFLVIAGVALETSVQRRRLQKESLKVQRRKQRLARRTQQASAEE